MIALNKVVCTFNNSLSINPITFSIFSKNQMELGEKVSIDRISSKIELYKVHPHSAVTLTPPLFVREIQSEFFHDISLREQTEYDFVIEVPILKIDIKEKQKLLNNPIYPLGNLKLRNYISFNNYDSWHEIEGYTYISGRLNFKNFVGIFKVFFDEAISQESFEFEVVSYKLSYETDFKNLINDLAEVQTEIILNLDSPTEITLDSVDLMEKTSVQVVLLQLRKLLSEQNLPSAVETILSNPYTKLTYENKIEKLTFPGTYDLKDMSSNPIDLQWKKEGALRKNFRGFTPLEYFKEEIDKTFNNKENQFIKFSLEELEKLILDLLSYMPRKFINSKRYLNNALNMIEEYLQAPLFKQIGQLTNLPNSMVLQRKSGYKEFLQLIHSFESGIQLNSNISEFDSTNGDLRPISELYEYWCFFQVYYCLKDICHGTDFPMANLLKKVDNGYKLNLEKTKQSRVLFKYQGLDITLFYNRNFTQENNELWEGTYDKGLFHPDISIRVKNKIQTHWFHFDSKYKLDKYKLERMMKGEAIQEGNYLRNDIHTAHSYRDAILGTRGVYILYPDIVDEEAIFIRHPYKEYKGKFLIPSIGAFPLKPGIDNSIQKEKLTSFLKKALKIIAQNHYYQEEIGFIEK